MNDDPLAAHLSSLHTAAVDARAGYEEGLKDADGKGMSPLFQAMIAIHTQNAAELAAALSGMGKSDSDQGSFMSNVNETIMGVRSWFGGLGDSVIPGLIDGEHRNLAQYDHALDLADLPPDIRALLTANRERLSGALEKMQALEPEKPNPS